MRKRRVCVVLADRANYGRLKPVMQALARRLDVEMLVVCAGTMLLERFGYPVQLVRENGFTVDGEVYLELEGSIPATMARSVGIGVLEFASEFQRLRPEIVLLVGDRFEALAAAVAAAYMNLCIVHLQGGEVSGSIDESARHAITKLAHYHVPSTRRAADFLIRLGERPETILSVGCPSSDLALRLDKNLDGDVLNSQGSGCQIDVTRNFLLALFHPVSTDYGGEMGQMEQLLAALQEVQLQTLLLWPNIDAGSDHVSKAIRVFRDRHKPGWLRTLINLNPEDYLRVLATTSCAVGNSSSFVREAGFFGTPVVLVGGRQSCREAGEHVLPVPALAAEVAAGIRKQLQRGCYPPTILYGDGQVSARVAQALASLEPYTQKRLAYSCESGVALS
ncbi:UDP-N-acetylglucosamine 2-epimerase (hydrolyzing) [bacterium CPR1]|nr:UDP-N-acetylglucosamine 2-epimerase (hydrolyzing) [bacterium CPR1]